MKNGILHTDPKGTKRWYYNGKLHRIDGPAVIYPHGEEQWYLNDQLHRLDGPAIVTKEGYQRWYQWGKLHRLTGPAIIYSSSDKSWYINHIKYTYREWIEKRKEYIIQENIQSII